jgi:RNA polymerase sigma-70 factor (ECF subfamily)
MLEPIGVDPQSRLEQLLIGSRATLHRYCARMTGSVIDGEDVVQEVLLKVVDRSLPWETLVNPEAWLFRVAHNATLDFLRRRARENALFSAETPDIAVDDRWDEDERQEVTATSLRMFMQLPIAQRSCVILMDVLGYSLREVGAMLELSVPAVKAALHRGRTQLRSLATTADSHPSAPLGSGERALLATYIDRFNAQDFDGVREMLAEEVRLDLVAKTRMKGCAEVSTYFSNYSRTHDWRLVCGRVEGRPAILVHSPGSQSERPCYFVLLDWRDGKIVQIRDFRYARYAVEGAEFAAI